jgi:hypothetical protein
MTWAVNHPNRQQGVGSSTWTDTNTKAGTAPRPVRVPWVGLLIALLGAWGGIVAFVGPVFGYHPTTATSWQWTTTNWLLHLIPGAMALVAGLVILAWQTEWGSLRSRSVLGFASLLTVVAGAWFVIGPALWPWFQSSPPYGPSTDALTSFVNVVGANLGPGVLLAMLGGMALKTAISAKRMATGADPAVGVPVAPAGGSTGPDGTYVSEGTPYAESGGSAAPDGGYVNEGTPNTAADGDSTTAAGGDRTGTSPSAATKRSLFRRRGRSNADPVISSASTSDGPDQNLPPA